MTPWIKYLLCKHEDLSWTSWIPMKKLGLALIAYNLSTGVKEGAVHRNRWTPGACGPVSQVLPN